jgi:hypothetical protein
VISLHFLRNDSVGGSLLLHVPETSIYFNYFSWKLSFPEFCGSGPRILNDCCRKTTLWQTCVWYNYTLFIWALCQDWKVNNTCGETMHTGMMDRGLTVYTLQGRVRYVQRTVEWSYLWISCMLNLVWVLKSVKDPIIFRYKIAGLWLRGVSLNRILSSLSEIHQPNLIFIHIWQYKLKLYLKSQIWHWE